MSQTKMPEPVAAVIEGIIRQRRGADLEEGETLITTTQAEAYADARVREVQQWQPIDTAPKEGRTLLLGYHNSHGNWRTVRGQWMSEAYIAEHWEDPDDIQPGWFETSVEADDIPNCWRIEPSHWMPLPAPPQQ